MSDAQSIQLSKLHYITGKISAALSSEIDAEVQGMLRARFKTADKYKYSLAGEIEHEYILKQSAASIERFMQDAAVSYWTGLGRIDLAFVKHVIKRASNTVDPNIKDVWVNFQKKYEYNPLHFHSGKLSFVIWHKIPYDLARERDRASHRGANQSAGPGTFSFTYPDLFNYGNNSINTHNIIMDKSYEGHYVLFPSFLQHSVAPFYTSNDYRISIAGNMDFE